MKKIILAAIFLNFLNCYGMEYESYNFLGISQIKERRYCVNGNRLKLEREEVYKFDKTGEILKENTANIDEDNEERVEVVYDENNKIVKSLYFYQNNLYKTVEEKTEIDKKTGIRKEIEIYTSYSDGKETCYGEGSIEMSYNKKNQLIKLGDYIGQVTEIYYKYDSYGKVIEELSVGADSNTIAYYKYKDKLLVEEDKYKFDMDLWSESEYIYPDVPANEPKKLWSVTKYEYSYYKDGILSYEKLNSIVAEYGKNSNIKNILYNLESSGIKYILKKQPVYFTQGQYVSILNNYAYFLSETERYKEAMPILERVIEHDKNRVVAYLNLGDCYNREYSKNKDEKVKKKVVENYRKYIWLLKKDAKIPERVKEMIK